MWCRRWSSRLRKGKKVVIRSILLEGRGKGLTLTEAVGEVGGEGEGVLNRALACSRLCRVAFLVRGSMTD